MTGITEYKMISVKVDTFWKIKRDMASLGCKSYDNWAKGKLK